MKVLVVTGSSGGHIFPAFSLIDTLKNKYKDTEALLVLPKRILISKIPSLGCRISYISLSSVGLKFSFKNLVCVGNLIKGSLESIIILIRFSPDAVVGFGSLICLPLVFFAWLLRIPTLIHEQNIMPGRANRFLAQFVDKIAVSFTETKIYFGNRLNKKIIITGNPLRAEFRKIDKDKALDYFWLKPDKFTILVMGGSAGSHNINMNFLNAVSMIPDAKLQIIHIAGPGDYDLLNSAYKNLRRDVRLFTFLTQIPYAYAASDLALCRAGAMTIAEIIFFMLPAIIIPYPFAYRHQANNAMFLERYNCAIVVSDNQLQPVMLKDTIEGLLRNPDKIKQMRSSYVNIQKQNANDLLADEVFSLTGDIN